jgi:hypothetical protein
MNSVLEGTQFLEETEISEFSRLLGNTSSMISIVYRSLIRKSDRLKNYHEGIMSPDSVSSSDFMSSMSSTINVIEIGTRRKIEVLVFYFQLNITNIIAFLFANKY